MPRRRIRAIVGWILAVVLGALYLLAGLGKLAGGEAVAEMFSSWGYPPWFAILIGGLEVAGAIGLLIPRTTRPAIAGLAIIMLGAVATHLYHGEIFQSIRPVVFLVGLWLLCWLRSKPAAPPAP